MLRGNFIVIPCRQPSHELLITSVSKYIIQVEKEKKNMLIRSAAHKINISAPVNCRKVNKTFFFSRFAFVMASIWIIYEMYV